MSTVHEPHSPRSQLDFEAVSPSRSRSTKSRVQRGSTRSLCFLPLIDRDVARVGDATYSPYHGDSSTTVALFALSDAIVDVLLREGFDQWNRANDRLPADEIVFFAGHSPKIQAVPYENMVFFYSLSEWDVSHLFSLGADFRHNLYVSDMTSLLIDRR